MAANLKEVVTESAATYADLRAAQYVAPRGLGLHLVLLLPDRTPIIIGTAQGSTTFAPGDIVLTGAPQGSRNRVIVGKPAPGLGGASAFATSIEAGELDLPRILAVTPSEMQVGTTSTLYVVGLLLRTSAPFDIWEFVLRVDPSLPYVLDFAGRVLSVAAVPDPGAVGLSLEGDQVAVALSVEIFPETEIGHQFNLRVRR
jgi:hypothetical protein